MPFFTRKSTQMVAPDKALPGRTQPIPTATTHHVFNRPLGPSVPSGMEQAMFGMGCFWGVERLFWQMPGIWMTMAGYAGGYTPNPTYDETCTGLTGHTEVVWLVFDPAQISYDALLRAFWEGHDPTQGMRQGNDLGSQYRSAIFCYGAAQAEAAQDSQQAYQQRLDAAGLGKITTEIKLAPAFYHAEDYHQQYLSKNPGGYCGLGGTGVSCPLGTGA